VDDAAKAAVSKEAADAAREMNRRGLAERLAAIDLDADENASYGAYYARVAGQVAELRTVLESLRTKQSERVWLRNQASGELDDSRLLDGAAGERLVFRRRGDAPSAFTDPNRADDEPQARLYFAVDVSGSMYRFNGADGRLERLLECTLMVMEALGGFGAQFDYAVVGHSGDGPEVPLVAFGAPPQDRKARLQVLQRMVAHAQFCYAGDHTVEAAQLAVKAVKAGDPHDGGKKRHFAFVLSDANLKRYDIRPAELGAALTADPAVSAHLVMVASVADEALKVQAAMPPGSASVCLDAADLPELIKAILSASIDQ
jgi:hypothetical protein